MIHPYRRIAGMLLLALLLAVVFFAGVAVGGTFASGPSDPSLSTPAGLFNPLTSPASGSRVLNEAPHVPGGIQPALGEVRESAVGWHSYADPVPGGASPSPTAVHEQPAPTVAGSATPGVSVSGTLTGIASWMPERFGPAYLALPEGPGIRVRICAATCLVMVSTDAGPDLASQRAGRVADIGVLAWERITGLPRGRGLAAVTLTP